MRAGCESDCPHKGVKMKKIAIMTYAKASQVELILKNHENAIGAYAWIVHDKDKTDIHSHIFMTFNSDRRGVDILKWFECTTDQKDEKANTRYEAVKSNEGLISYLTHEKNPEKHHYEEKEIHYSSEDARNELLETCDVDNGFDALEMMLNNIPLKDIARKHGRDFIRHYISYKTLADDIRKAERRKEEDKEMLKAFAELEETKKEMLFKIKALEQGHIDTKTGEIL